MTVTELPRTLSHRDRVFLKAVAAGRVELTCGHEPEIFVDGLSWCDPFAARALVHTGLVRSGQSGPHGARVRAELTPLGRAEADL